MNERVAWGRSRIEGLCHLGIVMAAYTLLTVILTWPVAARLSVAVAGFEALDSLQYTWSLWWSQHAWTALGQNPAQVTLLNHPWGGEHALLHVTPMLDWLALPLYRVAMPTQVYNLLFLASFVLTATSLYALAFEITGHRLASFLAGMLFSFFANRMGHALSGHLTQLASWWMPLYVLLFLRTVREPRWPRALAAGVCLGLGLLVALIQSAYFVGPLVALLLVCVAVSRRRALTRRHLVAAVVLFGIAALIVSPWYLPFLLDAIEGGADLSAPGAVDHSVDALTLLVPSPYHPLWGGAVRAITPIAERFPEANELEHMAYLGWVPLALAGVAVARRARGRGAWLLIGSIALLLSLGPVLVIGNRVTGWPLPYALLMRLPFFNWGRTPERFNQLTLFCLALLAAQGLAALGTKRGIQVAIVALALVEAIAIWPFPQGTPVPPAHIATWRGESGAVLHLPIKKRQIGNLALYYQTLHQRPIVGGYIHRELPGAREYVKAINAALTDVGEDATRPMTPAETAGLLRGLDIDHVVLHRQFVQDEWFEETASRLRAALGVEPLDCGSTAIFDIPGSAGLPTGPRSAELEPGGPGQTGATPCITYGESMSLLASEASSISVSPGKALTITLTWRAERAIPRDLTVYVHLLDASGARVAQHDGQPAGGNWPTTRWAPGSLVVDQHALMLPEDLSGATLTPVVGVYDLGTGKQYEASLLAGVEDLGRCAPTLRIAEPANSTRTTP